MRQNHSLHQFSHDPSPHHHQTQPDTSSSLVTTLNLTFINYKPTPNHDHWQQPTLIFTSHKPTIHYPYLQLYTSLSPATTLYASTSITTTPLFHYHQWSPTLPLPATNSHLNITNNNPTPHHRPSQSNTSPSPITTPYFTFANYNSNSNSHQPTHHTSPSSATILHLKIINHNSTHHHQQLETYTTWPHHHQSQPNTSSSPTNKPKLITISHNTFYTSPSSAKPSSFSPLL